MGSFYMEATQINYRRDEALKTVDQKLQELSETSAIDTDIAPVFKSTNTYAPGDLVYYRNKLYRFNVEHTGAWAAGDVTATDVTTEVSSLRSGLTNYQAQNDLNLEVPNRKNIAAGVASFETTIQFATALYVDCNLKPSTTYTLSFDGTEGNQLYANENIFVQDTIITIGSSRTSVTVTTKSTIPSSEYTEGKGWRFLKNKITEPNDNTFMDVQLEYGSTATTFAPYIPSVESRIEAVEYSTISAPVAYLPEVTIDAAQVWKNGKVVNCNVKFTTSALITARNYLITGLPTINTAVPHGNAVGSVCFNKPDAYGSFGNLIDGTYCAVSLTADLPAGTYCASFSYIGA